MDKFYVYKRPHLDSFLETVKINIKIKNWNCNFDRN
jgi:hypothetical protein